MFQGLAGRTKADSIEIKRASARVGRRSTSLVAISREGQPPVVGAVASRQEDVT